MSCGEFRNLLNAALDGQLDEAQRPVLDAHLAECAECRAARESLEQLDAALVRGVRPLRARGDVVAERTLERLQTQLEPGRMGPSIRPHGRSGRWWSYVVATAAGFVLAAILFRPWPPASEPFPVGIAESPQHPPARPDGPSDVPTIAVTPAIARVVTATGPIEVRHAEQGEWTSVEDLKTFACPSDTSVRTTDESLCELETDEGCRIRMNAGTELALRGDGEVYLAQGQLWCRAPESAALRIVAQSTLVEPVGKGTAPPDGSPVPTSCVVQCETPWSMLTSVHTGSPLTVTAASGPIDVVVDGKTQRLDAGASARLAGSEVVLAEPSHDLLLRESWMHPLLVRKGFGDPEVTSRVDGLLAHLGRTKLRLLYERDIRSLGEYGALPLLRFVQSAPSREDQDQRRTASEILADVAPAWMVADLIGLLDDDDPEVRFRAALALQRLTGETQGLPATEWRQPSTVWADAHAQWLAWWRDNRHAYPTPPVGARAG
jgi:hypothetical protein